MNEYQIETAIHNATTARTNALRLRQDADTLAAVVPLAQRHSVRTAERIRTLVTELRQQADEMEEWAKDLIVRAGGEP